MLLETSVAEDEVVSEEEENEEDFYESLGINIDSITEGDVFSE